MTTNEHITRTTHDVILASDDGRIAYVVIKEQIGSDKDHDWIVYTEKVVQNPIWDEQRMSAELMYFRSFTKESSAKSHFATEIEKCKKLLEQGTTEQNEETMQIA